MLKKSSLLPKNKWPKRLLEIPEPPRELWICGKLPPKNHIWLTIVGSRKATSYGRDICKELVQSLAGQKVVIVSGLAVGIDSIALEAALEAKLPCVGVPGSGLDQAVLYPPQSLPLAEKIVKKNKGCLLSEFMPDTKSALWTFPKRNRIMAGLSHAVLIIEAEQKSGTLITSRLATEYNRDVLAVPGSVFSKQSFGPHMLIKLGATPITCPEDLSEALGFDIDAIQKERRENKLADLNKVEQLVVSYLREPKTLETLSTEVDLQQQTLNEILVGLELKGVIKSSSGYLRIN